MEKTKQGQSIKCKFCGGEAKIIMVDYQNKVRCSECQAEYYLKEQHINSKPIQYNLL